MDVPIDAFVDLVRDHKKPGMSVAEIGCFDGATSKYAIVPVHEMKGTYTVVDWFKGTRVPDWEASSGEHVYKPDKHVRKDFERNLTGFESCYKIIESTTQEASLSFDDESLDICFIDADHSYRAVAKDLDLYFPKVKRGGIICGHDFDDATPDFSLCRKAMAFSEEELSRDWVPLNHRSDIEELKLFLDRNPMSFHQPWLGDNLIRFHGGVAKAVYERFGEDINRVPNQHHSPPIWWKYKE
mgnify:CR=1 FL=1|tara:strand:+ start:789 stop:1511 length:723 start_codon:yes stop_codon:yes gene_type:complete